MKIREGKELYFSKLRIALDCFFVHKLKILPGTKLNTNILINRKNRELANFGQAGVPNVLPRKSMTHQGQNQDVSFNLLEWKSLQQFK